MTVFISFIYNSEPNANSAEELFPDMVAPCPPTPDKPEFTPKPTLIPSPAKAINPTLKSSTNPLLEEFAVESVVICATYHFNSRTCSHFTGK